MRTFDTSLPVSLDKLKEHLHITTTDFDESLDTYLKAAILSCENYINGMIWVSEVSYVSNFSNIIPISDDPIISVNSVKVDGNEINTNSYSLQNGKLYINSDVQGSKIEYTLKVGYEQVPEPIQVAILLQASKMFTNPVDSVETLPKASQGLLNAYKNWRI